MNSPLSRLNLLLLATVAAAGSLLAAAPGPTPLLTQPAAKLIAVLKSDAGQKEKADACRELAVIGDREAVAALAALLGDEQLSHMARYALETIPSPEVDRALREALGKVQGRLLAGVIGSLGVRRDLEAVPALKPFLMASDPDVAQAAARALGRLVTSESIQALQAALAKAPAPNQLALCEGLLRCAEASYYAGQGKTAQGIFDQLRAVPGAPHQVRAAALRGAVLTRGEDGVPLLMEAVRGQDWVLVAAAARVAIELTNKTVSLALGKELPALPAEKQILIIQVLAQSHQPVATPSLLSAAETGPKAVRLAALRGLAVLGQPEAVLVLVKCMRDQDPDLARAAQESLAAMPGRQVDAAIVAMLAKGTPDERLHAIDLVGRRRMAGCVPDLLRAAGGADAEVRPAALKKLGELARPAEFPALIALLKSAKEARDLDAGEQALSALCARMADPEGCTAKLSGALAQAGPAPQGALLRVLTSVGGPAALRAVRAAADDRNAEVHAAAIRALATWRSADVAGELLGLAKVVTDPTERTLCLRSYLDWASHPDLPLARRLSMCQEASPLLQRTEEKRLLLAALGGISSGESAGLIAPFLDDPATAQEASAALVGLAADLLKKEIRPDLAGKLVAPLRKAAQLSTNADLAERAKNLAERVQAKAEAK